MTEREIIAPAVGMGATELCYSDLKAFTIIAVNDRQQRITLQRDNTTFTEMNAARVYDYTANPDGETVHASLRANGYWVAVGDRTSNGRRFVIGSRVEYYDYSF